MLIDHEIKRKFIPELIVCYLQQNGVDFITSLPEDNNCTISDIVKYCNDFSANIGKSCIDFDTLVREAVSKGYDARYFSTDESSDERYVDFNTFLISFNKILEELNLIVSYENKDVIVVGVGNGFEGKMLYNKIKNLTIVDIAPQSLCRAKSVLYQAKAYQEDASNLASIMHDSFDLYISLRTYQSTYFDIRGALREAKRVLKSNGVIILSVACGYINKNKEFIYGLFNPHSGFLDKDRPDLFLNTIKNELEQSNFKVVGIKKIPAEIFIYAVKY